MRIFFIMILFILALIMIVGGGLTYLFRFLTNFQPGSNKLNADLQELKLELEDWASTLVPWNKEELELLSLNQTNKTTTKGPVQTIKGIFTSIYHESTLAYAYKKYAGNDAKALLFARTSNRSFTYLIKSGAVDISINGDFIGTLRDNGVLYSAKTNRLMARINRDKRNELTPILVNDKEVVSLLTPRKTTEVNSRAFSLVEEMSEEEESICLSLAVLEMVQGSFELA